jgi:hypothetical protein
MQLSWDCHSEKRARAIVVHFVTYVCRNTNTRTHAESEINALTSERTSAGKHGHEHTANPIGSRNAVITCSFHYLQ